MGMGSGTAAWE